jgi:hypothetical protein
MEEACSSETWQNYKNTWIHISENNNLQFYRVFLENKSCLPMKETDIAISEQFIPTFPIN